MGFRSESGDPRGGPGRVEGLSEMFGMGGRTLWEVQDGLWDPSGGPGRFGGTSGRSGTGQGTLGIPGQVVGPHGGPSRVGEPNQRSGTGRGRFRWSGTIQESSGRSRKGRGNLGQVRDGSGGSTQRAAMSWGTLEEVQDWTGDPRGGPRCVRGPSRRSRPGRRRLEEVWDVSADPPEGLGRVEGRSWWSGKVSGTLGLIWEGSGYPQ